MTSVVLFYIGPLYLNVVPWLEKIPADAHHFKTFSHLKNMHIFTRPMLMYKISLHLKIAYLMVLYVINQTVAHFSWLHSINWCVVADA